MNLCVKYFVLISILSKLNKSNAQLSFCSKMNPCKNGATCVDQPDTLYGYNCICAPGFDGLNCQSKTRGEVGNIIWGSGGTTGNNLKPNDKDTGIQVGPSGNSNQKIPGGINVNSGYPGGVNVNFPGSPGGGINVNSDFGGGINTNPCFNGGKFIKAGLPCSCPSGFMGNRCEINANSNFFPTNLCSSFPCRNNGRCIHPIGTMSFTCTCEPPYYGQKCEFYRSSVSNRVKYYSIGSLLPFLCCMCLIASCLYFCCFKKHTIANNGFMTRTQSFFGGNTGPRWNGPMAPIPTNPPNMIYRGPPPPNQGFNMMQPPNQGFNMMQPPNQGFNMMQTRAPLPMQDPDEAFKVYNSPPPYEETIRLQKPPNA